MKNLVIFLLTIFTLQNMCLMAKAQIRIISDFSNERCSSFKHSIYHNNYENFYDNNLTAFIYSRSLCDKEINSNLRAKSVSSDNRDTIFYLVNGETWKQYILFVNQIQLFSSSVHNYSIENTKPKVKIYRDLSTNSCKIMINDKDTGIYVYRIN